MRDRPYNRIYKEDDSRASELHGFYHNLPNGCVSAVGNVQAGFLIDFSFHQHEKCELFHFFVFCSGIYYSKSISNILKSHFHLRQFCKYSNNLWFKLRSKKLLGCLLSACHPVREMRHGGCGELVKGNHSILGYSGSCWK